MSLQSFLGEHGRSVQVIGTAIAVFAIGWLARRARPGCVEGWTQAHYPPAVKVLALLFLAFMTAALVFNGLALVEQDWWVIPAFLLVVAASYVFAYEVFFTRLRWNETEVEVRRFPFRPQAMKFRDIASLTFHSTTESVTLSSKTGARLWFPYGLRAGASRLFGIVRTINAEPED